MFMGKLRLWLIRKLISDKVSVLANFNFTEGCAFKAYAIHQGFIEHCKIPKEAIFENGESGLITFVTRCNLQVVND